MSSYDWVFHLLALYQASLLGTLSPCISNLKWESRPLGPRHVAPRAALPGDGANALVRTKEKWREMVTVGSCLSASREPTLGANALMLPQPPAQAHSQSGLGPSSSSLSGCKWLLQQSPSSPCPWVLEHSPHHLPQGNAFKTLAERKEIWGKCSQPPAATKQMWLSSSRHLTHPSEHLFMYLLCGQGEVAAKPLQEFPQWERF